MTWIFVRLIAAVCAVLLVSGCGGGQNSGEESAGSPSPESPVITGNPAGYNSADITFATLMIKHHQQAIELADLTPQRTDNQALLKLANTISAEQQPEIDTMKALLVQWGADPTMGDHGMHGGSAMQGMVDDATMTKLKSLNGPEFDTLWLQSMIAHHQGAIEMAKTEIAKGQSADLTTMAKSIVTSQQAEIDQMKQMLGG